MTGSREGGREVGGLGQAAMVCADTWRSTPTSTGVALLWSQRPRPWLSMKASCSPVTAELAAQAAQ